jgi:hypothetical protein
MVTDADGLRHPPEPALRRRFLGIDDRKKSIGRHCTEVVENTRMHVVGQTGDRRDQPDPDDQGAEYCGAPDPD